MTIGNRAFKAIKERARKNGVSVYQEAKKIEGLEKVAYSWKDNMNPSTYWLQQMAFAGYDVIWILTGGKEVACR